MRRLFTIAIAASALASGAQAQEPVYSRKDTVCKDIESLASRIMKVRQSGRLMSEALEQYTKGRGSSIPFIESMVEEAYEQPRFSVPENQERAVVDFQNEQFLFCRKNFEG
ncbi:MAG: hypothetical protein SGJ21_07540 [Alphaproteobacteria bacterium]|nr:hypothetical protein [Alphaproteobacteria bacterium]